MESVTPPPPPPASSAACGKDAAGGAVARASGGVVDWESRHVAGPSATRALVACKAWSVPHGALPRPEGSGTPSWWHAPGAQLESLAAYSAHWRDGAARDATAPHGGDEAFARAVCDAADAAWEVRHPAIRALLGVTYDEACGLPVDAVWGAPISPPLHFVSDAQMPSLTEPQMMEAVRQLASALEFLHARDTAHRGVSCDTVLVGVGGHTGAVTAQLGGLFESRLIGRLRTQSGGRGGHGHGHGTSVLTQDPAFCAPEEVLSAHPSPPADVFSLGVVALHMITREPPHADTRDAHLEAACASHPVAGAIVARCLEPTAHARPTAAQLQRECADVLHTMHDASGSGSTDDSRGSSVSFGASDDDAGAAAAVVLSAHGRDSDAVRHDCDELSLASRLLRTVQDEQRALCDREAAVAVREARLERLEAVAADAARSVRARELAVAQREAAAAARDAETSARLDRFEAHLLRAAGIEAPASAVIAGAGGITADDARTGASASPPAAAEPVGGDDDEVEASDGAARYESFGARAASQQPPLRTADTDTASGGAFVELTLSAVSSSSGEDDGADKAGSDRDVGAPAAAVSAAAAGGVVSAEAVWAAAVAPRVDSALTRQGARGPGHAGMGAAASAATYVSFASAGADATMSSLATRSGAGRTDDDESSTDGDAASPSRAVEAARGTHWSSLAYCAGAVRGSAGAGGRAAHADESVSDAADDDSDDDGDDTSGHHVFAWGCTADGRLGFVEGGKPSTGPTRSLDHHYVLAVSCGEHHSLALTAEGRVLSFGQGTCGQLGLGRSVESTAAPLFVDRIGAAVMSVSAGGHHSCAVAITGDLWSWGSGGAGKLGLGSDENEWVPRKVTEVRNVGRVCAGYSSTMVVTDDGKLLAAGGNGFGKLGLGHDVFGATTPRQVMALKDHTVVDASVHHRHVLVRTDTGQLFAFGSNCSGQLGLGHTRDEYHPVRVTALRNAFVTQVAAGDYHSVVLTASGDVWSFGRASFGRLGLGSHTSTDQTVPRKVDGLAGIGIVDIAVSNIHSCVVTHDGELYVWGSNGDGRLAMGADVESLSRPCKVDALVGAHVSCVAPGGKHTVAVVDITGQPC